MMRIAVIGASGFIGRETSAALARAGAQTIPVQAPRIDTSARTLKQLRREMDGVSGSHCSDILGLPLKVDAAINCAGISKSSHEPTDALFGANSLLPAVILRACQTQGIRRFVHVSSAAVQGRVECLTEEPDYSPFSHYSASKALAEQLLLPHASVVIFRPTSVHGPTRSVTKKLIRFAASPLAITGSPGTNPTPQVHIHNVALAAQRLCELDYTPAQIVLQPSENWTTLSFLRTLGNREPILLPNALSGLARAMAHAFGKQDGSLAGDMRRLELLLLGQDQAPSSLPMEGWPSLPTTMARWHELVAYVRAEQPPGHNRRLG